MIHIVFNEPDINLLKQAIALDEQLEGNVIQIKDDYAVGPLLEIYSDEGIQNRKNFWRKVLEGTDDEKNVDEGKVDDNKTVSELKELLNSDTEETVWIWAAQNKHDVCGYYWLMQQLKDFQGRVFILYLNNLPFLNEKGQVFYPNWISEIPAKEFLKAKKLARQITISEFEIDPDEWAKLCMENGGVRLLEGGKKLISEGEDYYDAELKKYVTGDWQKASKIIHHFLNKAKHTTGDSFLLWRLKCMIEKNGFDVQGKIGNMKDFELKIPSVS